MTKPQMIRADTIDLQDQNSPSAKDHSRQPTSPAAMGDGPPAPHQAASLKRASLDGHELSSRSPRASQDLSTKELQLLHDTQSDVDDQDAAEIEQGLGGQRNGDLGGQDGDTDGEDDESLEDDMMDKISSSPSIDDGGYSRPGQWPVRGDSLLSTPESARKARESSEVLSSSPYEATPSHMPLGFLQKKEDHMSEDHHIPGEYPQEPELPAPRLRPPPPLPLVPRRSLPPPLRPLNPLIHEDSMEIRDRVTPLITESGLRGYQERDNGTSYDDDFDDSITSLDDLLVPLNDPLLEDSFDNVSLTKNNNGPHNDGSSEISEPPSPIFDKDNYDENDDDADDLFFEDARFVDSGWGGECLREVEDIDFEFVYALHTFVATVEGQANATKGDTMVLLDDSNSYWWLVRVVKDSSIGYLPAEHIETPTERLARLNKHRNIDLSQTMLGDNPEKSRNPLKKAMRRRNAKTVTFSDPTYYEASDNEYPTDSEDDDEREFAGNGDVAREDAQAQQQHDDQRQQHAQNDSIQVEPLQVNRSPQKTSPVDQKSADEALSGSDSTSLQDNARTSSEVLESQQDDPSQPRTGRRMRNTDSFYKDDSIETRKITLTPNLLREDNSSGQNVAVSQDLKARESLEGTSKPSSLEKGKDEKKKEKKPSKFGSLFKRSKDKKKGQQDDDDDWLKDARGNQQSPQPKASSDSMSVDSMSQASPQKTTPVRQTSKLQKAPPAKSNSMRKIAEHEEPQEAPQQRQEPISSKAPRVESALIPDGALSNPFEDTEAYEPEYKAQQPQPLQVQSQPQNRFESMQPQPLSIQTQQEQSTGPQQQPQQQNNFQSRPSEIATRSMEPSSSPEVSSPQESSIRKVFSPLRGALRPNTQPDDHPKAERVKKAKNRMALDESDTSEDEQGDLSSFPSAPSRQPPAQYGQQPTTDSKDRLSESPVQVSPVIAPSRPPLLVGDSSSHSEDGVSPVSPSSTPELIERPYDGTSTPGTTHSVSKGAHTPQPPGAFPTPPTTIQTNTPPMQQGGPASAATTPVSTRSQPEWSDAHLRQYLETAQEEIRDLLLVVGSQSDVVVGKDDPTIKKFEPDMNKFKEMEKRLDRMMVDLCARHGV